ncbi:MAG: DEAD/DEAH box helicase family protein [Candidatus Nanopelagicales bacterium]|nr:DEAD/DEAH box helicase family protein [Candidatus Nanopelagicales bacterium]
MTAPAHLRDSPLLRRWQMRALQAYVDADARDFLVTATPGSGKTTYALSLAGRLLAQRVVQRVIVVVPTDHLRGQWADAAAKAGLWLDPTLPNSVGPVREGTLGYVATYAQVAAKPMLHRGRAEARPTLVIMDEIHHAGDGLTWGDGLREAFDTAKRRLGLSGTPFRTKADERIPFVSYEEEGDEVRSLADFAYSYGDALADGVVRPVVFAAYTGTSRWLNDAGDAFSAMLGGGTKKDEDKAWRTALSPTGRWVPHVIAAVDERVRAQRAAGIHDAAGIILANDQETARAYAAVAARVTGEAPAVVLSEDADASAHLSAFTTGTTRLVVCVRMISEGVDIPRATTLGYLCSARTPLFFSQAVGRVVRARGSHETASVYLPAVRPLLALAAEMESARNAVIRIIARDDHDLAPEVERIGGGEGFTALDADAQFAHVLTAGRAITADTLDLDDEATDYLGLPGLLSPQDMATLLAARDAGLRRQVAAVSEEPDVTPATWRDTQGVRKDIHRMVSVLAARTGKAHGQVHAELRRVVPGPPTAVADYDTLVARHDQLMTLVL